MADKKNKVREILLGKPPKPPTTGGKIKESVRALARTAELKGIGVGGKIKEFKSSTKGIPSATARWKVGIVKGAGVKPDPSGRKGRGRKARTGLQFKVKF